MKGLRRTCLWFAACSIFLCATVIPSRVSADFGGSARNCKVEYQTPTQTYVSCSGVRLFTSSPREVWIDGQRDGTANTVCGVSVYPFNQNHIYNLSNPLYSQNFNSGPGSGIFVAGFTIPSNILGYVLISCFNGSNKYPMFGYNIQ